MMSVLGNSSKEATTLFHLIGIGLSTFVRSRK